MEYSPYRDTVKAQVKAAKKNKGNKSTNKG